MVLYKWLQDSAYGDRFAGGVFTHSALRTFNYHRWLSSVAGTVVEARIVQGQAWLKVDVMELAGDADEEPKRAARCTGHLLPICADAWAGGAWIRDWFGGLPFGWDGSGVFGDDDC